MSTKRKIDPIIYAHLDPVNNDVRYIGKSMFGLERAYSHWRPSVLKAQQASYHKNWIRKVIAGGHTPVVVVLERLDQNCTNDELSEREIWWIAFARAWSCRLTNVTDGGEGKSGYIYSPEQRVFMQQIQSAPGVQARRSAAVKETLGSLDVIKKLCAFQNTPEAKARQKGAGAAHLQSAEIKKKQRATLFDPVVREKINRAQRDFHVNEKRRSTLAQTNARPEIRAKRSVAMKEVFSREGMYEQHQASTLKAMHRPDVRERHLANIKAYWARERARRKPRMRINLLSRVFAGRTC